LIALFNLESDFRHRITAGNKLAHAGELTVNSPVLNNLFMPQWFYSFTGNIPAQPISRESALTDKRNDSPYQYFKR